MKSRGNLDLRYIWEHQSLQPSLVEFIKEASSIVNNYILSLTQKGDNPIVKAKNMAFWNDVQLRLATITELDRSLIDVHLSDELSQDQIARIKELKDITLDWSSLLSWGKSTRNLSLLERKRIERLIADLNSGKDLDYKIANDALNILAKSEDLGFVR